MSKIIGIGSRIESSGHLGTVTWIEKSGVTIKLDIGREVVVPLTVIEESL